jgi:hypothetical protein
MTVERRLPFQESIEVLEGIYPQVEIIVKGDPSSFNRKPVHNCVDQGAGKIKITIGEGRLRFEDDVIHNNPGEILANLNSEEPKSTGLGGFSIQCVRRVLKRHNGELKYHAEGGRIIAVATWET